MFTNGAPSVSCRPLLQAGDAKAGQRLHRRGRNKGGLVQRVLPCRGLQARRRTVVAHERAFRVPPSWLRLRPSLLPDKKSASLKRLSRMNSNKLPCTVLVPGHGVHGGAGANSAACFLTTRDQPELLQRVGNGRCMPVPSKLFR